MLGSVFNTSSEPVKARLRSFQIGKESFPFSEFRGLGPPGLNIGLAGDIYLDLTPGLPALYARYSERWTLWPDATSDTSTLLLHPMHSNRYLWCNDTINWFNPRNIKVNPSKTASELLSETLKHQATISEGSRKRKKDTTERVHPGPVTNTSSPNTQSPTSFLHSTRSTTTPRYSPPTLEIMIPGSSMIQKSTGSPTTDSPQNSIPTEVNHMSTSEDFSQEPYTSPKWINLRNFAKKRRAAFNVSISSSKTSRKDDQLVAQSNNANSAGNPLANNSDLQTSLPQSISFNLSDTTAYDEEDLSIESLLAKAIQGNPVDRGPIVNIAIAKLRKMQDASDANVTYLRAANDKIRRLEAENAQLRAEFVNQCQCKLSSCDILPLVETPFASDSNTLNGALDAHGTNGDQPNDVGLGQSQAGSADPGAVSTGNITVEADAPSLDECKSFESSTKTSLSVEENFIGENSWYVSPTPTISKFMRDIHRSVLFAKAGSLFICRLCLGTQSSGGIEAVAQIFKTLEGSSELMQGHCEKEHPNDYEALMNMGDEELLDLVSMISSECKDIDT